MKKLIFLFAVSLLFATVQAQDGFTNDRKIAKIFDRFYDSVSYYSCKIKCTEDYRLITYYTFAYLIYEDSTRIYFNKVSRAFIDYVDSLPISSLKEFKTCKCQ